MRGNGERARSAVAHATGARLRAARLIADLSIEVAAGELGMQVTAVEMLEEGRSSLDVPTLRAIADLYGTTTDHLLGLTTDGDRDPALSVMRHVSARIQADVQRLTQETVNFSIDAVRALFPGPNVARQLAEKTLAASQALATFRRLNEGFDDDLRGGADLVGTVDTAAIAAKAVIDHCERALRAACIRYSTVAATGDGQQTLGLIPAQTALDAIAACNNQDQTLAQFPLSTAAHHEREIA